MFLPLFLGRSQGVIAVKGDFSHHALCSIEFTQDVIGKQIQQHHHQDRHKCLSWVQAVV